MRANILFLIIFFYLFSVNFVFSNDLSKNYNIKSKIDLFDNWIKTHISYLNLCGISIAVIKDQKIIYSNNYGLINQDENIKASTDSIFKIASITKIFTSIAIVKLAEEGKIDLNDKIIKYIPELKNINGNGFDINNIKIKNLLTHTSGLPMNSDYHWNEKELEDPISFLTVLDRIENQKIIYKPNRRFKYSNLGMTIGGILIERISGIKYHQYIEKNIFNILDMSNSSFSKKDKNEDNIAVGYTNLIDKKRKKHLFTNLVGKIDQPGAGAMSTINDLSKFVKWHFRVLDDNDNLIISKKSLKNMQKLKWAGLPFDTHPIFMSVLSFFLRNFYNYGYGYGYGSNGIFVGHSGGHYGYSSELLMDNKNKIGIIILSNTSDTPTRIKHNYSISKNLYEIIAKSFLNEQNDVNPNYINYSNTYSDNFFMNIYISASENHLVIYDLNSSFPMTRSFVYENIGLDKFRAISDIGFYFAQGESEIIFERNSSNKIISLKGPTYTLYPISTN